MECFTCKIVLLLSCILKLFVSDICSVHYLLWDQIYVTKGKCCYKYLNPNEGSYCYLLSSQMLKTIETNHVFSDFIKSPWYPILVEEVLHYMWPPCTEWCNSSTKVAQNSFQQFPRCRFWWVIHSISWCYNHGSKKLPSHWWTWYYFCDTIGYHSNTRAC